MNEPGIQYELPSDLDSGIAAAVGALSRNGVETFESCQGGNGHAYPVPTVRFHGDVAEGFRALSVAMKEGLPVAELRRVWPIHDGEPTGPWWEITLVNMLVQNNNPWTPLSEGRPPGTRSTYG